MRQWEAGKGFLPLCASGARVTPQQLCHHRRVSPLCAGASLRASVCYIYALIWFSSLLRQPPSHHPSAGIRITRLVCFSFCGCRCVCVYLNNSIISFLKYSAYCFWTQLSLPISHNNVSTSAFTLLVTSSHRLFISQLTTFRACDVNKDYRIE